MIICVQVSELNENGDLLATFTGVSMPQHLSTDSEGHVFVADRYNGRILLLNSKLQLERVLVDTDSQVKPWRPYRLYYNELTSQLYVVHCSQEQTGPFILSVPNAISQFRLR